MQDLIRANAALLRQGSELFSRHDDASFGRACPETFGSSIGAHARHVLDHYLCYLRGIESGVVDYDDRRRGGKVETSCAAAIEAFAEAREGLGSYAGLEDASVDVRSSTALDRGETVSRSSLRRELQFLVSHTVHHYALVAIASRMQGVPPPEGFGVAPSTLKYLRSSAAKSGGGA